MDEPRDIQGIKDIEISWSPPDKPKIVKFDYIGRGVPDYDPPGTPQIHWLGYGLYQVKIKNLHLNDESEYIFYIDFQNSKWLALDGPGTDIKIIYDFLKPINQRVRIPDDNKTFDVEMGKVYRVCHELQLIPVTRHSTFYIRGNIPISDLNEDVLLSPAIVDMNTIILSYKDPTKDTIVNTKEPELLYSKIIIDPYLYPEPSKLRDLKLTIADNVTLTAQKRSALIVGDGAEISLGNNSMININPHGNLFIDANSNWSFSPNSQLILNGNFSILSKVFSSWNMLSVPNIVSDYRKIIVWPTSITVASTYEDGVYVTKDVLENGKGYWIKFNQNQNINYTGPPILKDTFNVVSGWNMIGSISLNLLKSKITSNPAGIISSPFYGFKNNGYYIADTLRPGLGYWIKVNQDGKLILDVNSVASLTPPQCSDQQPSNPPGAT